MMKNNISRTISLMLCFVLAFSVFGICAVAETSSQTNDYYVQYGGTGDGKTPETPARSVWTALYTMNQDGLGANDTANIYIMESDLASPDAYHFTPWVQSGDSLVGKHDAKIVLQGYEGQQQWLAFHADQASGSLELLGPTVMNNLNLVSLDGTDGIIYAHGYNLTLGNNMGYYQYRPGSLAPCSAPWVVGTTYAENGPFSTEQTVTYQSSGVGGLYVASNNTGGWNHAEDMNFVLDNPNIGQPNDEFSIYLGTGYFGHYFNKNLNITVRDANHIGFHALAYQGTNIRVDGGFQILTKSGVQYDGDGVSNTTLANAVSSVSSLSAPGGIWTLTTDDTDKLSFTDTAGTYTVADGYVATATPTAGGDAIESEYGYLTLPAGDYTISFAEVHNYYVQYGGTGDGKTPEAPARSVWTALNTMNQDRLGANDTAIIYIMESDLTSPDALYTFTPWMQSGDPSVAKHDAKIVLQGYDGPQWLAFHADQESGSLDLLGPTVMNNLNLVSLNRTDGIIYAHGYNLTLGNNMKFYQYSPGSLTECYAPSVAGTWNSETDHVYFEQTVTYRSSGVGALYVATNGSSGYAHGEDMNFVLDNPNIGQPNDEFSIVLGTESNCHYFNKNLNITVRNANHIGFRSSAYGSIQVDHGLQILTKSGVQYDGEGVPTTLADAVSRVSSLYFKDGADGMWTLTADDTDKLSFTDTAGTYTVADGYVATATPTAGGDAIESEDGILILPAGDYIIAFAEDYIQADTSEFFAEEKDVRDDAGADKEALRFVFDINKEFLGGISGVIEYGAIFMPTATLNGDTMLLSTQISGSTPTSVSAQYVLEETETDLKYSLCIPMRQSPDKDTSYTARGYIKYNSNGVTKIIYSAQYAYTYSS